MSRQMMLQIAALVFLLLTGITIIEFAILVVNTEMSSITLPELGQTMSKEVILPRCFFVMLIFLVPAVIFGIMARKSAEAPASKKSR
ncbi:MAG: hypothetical protein KF824_10915 [Fimbriimonadaceae bacterium]|nr:MAG: hypothetical protein KF824_10915 [Fimbriimonadaceae bacterium]